MDRSVILRIIDANANRCSEGLRVLEETARFSLEDRELLSRLKEARHEARDIASMLAGRGTRFRRASEDVGRNLTTPSERSREGVGTVIKANFCRVEEALRVIEEYGKTLDPAQADRAKALRFEVYTLEKLFARRPGVPALPRPPFLYTILDREYVEEREVGSTAAAMAAGGSDMIQYRAKERTDRERSRDVESILASAGTVPVIVNDDPKLALRTGAAGVHLGAGDPSPWRARSILGPEALIGVTAHTAEEIRDAAEAPVDYIGFGAVFASGTKPEVIEKGIDGLALACMSSDLPVVAIGGIGSEDISAVVEAGAAGVAVVRAALEGDVMESCSRLASALRAFRQKAKKPRNGLT